MRGDTPSFGHAFSNVTHFYFRTCECIWLSSVRLTWRAADAKKKIWDGIAVFYLPSFRSHAVYFYLQTPSKFFSVLLITHSARFRFIKKYALYKSAVIIIIKHWGMKIVRDISLLV